MTGDVVSTLLVGCLTSAAAALPPRPAKAGLIALVMLGSLAEPMAAGSMTITRVTDGKWAALLFAAGQAIANWPAAVAGSDGAFRVANGTGPPTMLTIKLLAKAPTAIDELGAALLETGCAAQFERLANSTKAPAPAP